jgi:hypothetical protein
MRARHYSLCSTLHAGGEDSGCIVGNWEVDFWFARDSGPMAESRI